MPRTTVRHCTPPVTLLLVLSLVAACGAPEPASPAQVGLVEVQLQRLQLSPGTELQELGDAYRGIAEDASDLEAWRLAAEALYCWGQALEREGDYAEARDAYLESLAYEKREHERLRGPDNPHPNSANIAAVLTSIAVMHERLGEEAEAARYAGRAFHINRTLGFEDRMLQDLDRLIRLHTRLDNQALVTELEAYREDVKLRVETGQGQPVAGPMAGPEQALNRGLWNPPDPTAPASTTRGDATPREEDSGE